MRKLFLFLSALILLFPSPVRAQTSTVALDSLAVSLWSEHDQPSMLVLLDFTVTRDTHVPASVEIRVPRDANITAVAYQSPAGLLLANYQTQLSQDSKWQVVTLFVTERTVYRIEYYQPLERDGDKRTFTYQWTGDYPVGEFNIEVQVPGDSRGIKTDPAILIMQAQAFLSGGAKMNDLEQGQTYQLRLEYSRSTETPVVTPISSQVEALAPVDENADGRATLGNLPLFLGGFGAALILVALIYFFRGQSSAGVPKPRRRPHPAKESSAQAYCHECGTRAHEGDRFCRACGSKLRGN